MSQLNQKVEEKIKKIEAKGGIGNIIKKIEDELDLKKPCPGRKYNDLFINQTKVFDGYLPSPDDESSTDNQDE